MRAIALLLCLFVGLAHADAPEVDRAIKIGGEGIALYEQRQYAAAFERFSVADRMAHSVVFVLYMARCKRNLGELLAARALLEQVAREPLPPGAPAPMQRAHDEAGPELATLAGRIPAITVTVRGHGAAAARVRIDQRPVTPNTAIEVDPGEHVVEATSDDAVPVTRIIRLVEHGGTTTVALDLARAQPPRGSRAPALLALGVGAAGVGVATVTGIIALRTTNDVKEDCIDDHCFARDRAAADRAGRFATASTVSFVVAGAAIATGVALWIWRPGGRATIVATPVEGAQVSVVGRF